MLKRLSSSVITVTCLTLLLILTFWGTIAQVQQGLYASQERFFNSFFFLAGGFLPFPGAQSVLWVLFVNLLAMTLLSLKRYSQWVNAGLLITHVGLLFYFVAAFMVFHVSEESAIHLAEGQSTNVSVSYQAWELAYWTGEQQDRAITALDVEHFKSNTTLPFVNKNARLVVKEFHLNNVENNASGVFELWVNDKPLEFMLDGQIEQPATALIDGQRYYFILRHKVFPLPFKITLDSFKAEFLPGTSMAKNYESHVMIDTGSLKRQAKIFMNNPLKYKDYTIYQASYDKDQFGRQYSTLAVVKNFARVLPYVACLVVFFGLALHYLIHAFRTKEH